MLWRWVRIRAWFLRWADVRARSWFSLTRASQQQNPVRAQSWSPCLLAQPMKQVTLSSCKLEAERSLVSSRSLLGQWPGFLVDWNLSPPLCLGTVSRLWANVFLVPVGCILLSARSGVPWDCQNKFSPVFLGVERGSSQSSVIWSVFPNSLCPSGSISWSIHKICWKDKSTWVFRAQTGFNQRWLYDVVMFPVAMLTFHSDRNKMNQDTPPPPPALLELFCVFYKNHNIIFLNGEIIQILNLEIS